MSTMALECNSQNPSPEHELGQQMVNLFWYPGWKTVLFVTEFWCWSYLVSNPIMLIMEKLNRCRKKWYTPFPTQVYCSLQPTLHKWICVDLVLYQLCALVCTEKNVLHKCTNPFKQVHIVQWIAEIGHLMWDTFFREEFKNNDIETYTIFLQFSLQTWRFGFLQTCPKHLQTCLILKSLHLRDATPYVQCWL